MLLGCSYCRRPLREAAADGAGPSHVVCADCADRFERLWHATLVAERLEALPGAVLMLTPDSRVVAANSAAASLLRRDAAELRGLFDGEALACVHAVEPEGCGKASACRGCPIRRAVRHVAETGFALDPVAANLTTNAGRVDLRLGVHAKDGLVKVVVEEMKAAAG